MASSAEAEARAWATAGLSSLTGRPGRAGLGPPRGLVGRAGELADRIAATTGRLGRTVRLDPLGLLAERAAIAGHRRGGTTSCGGGTRLVETRSGWLACSLTRESDRELVPAWLGCSPDDDAWAAVERAAERRDASELVTAGAALGLPVARLGEVAGADDPVRTVEVADAPPQPLEGMRVVDLSSLWAGPLCASILADAGADVVKVESRSRLDGARRGPAAFYDLLNAGKRSVVVDISGGRDLLADLVAAADVVIEASRPRALRQMGIDAASVLRDARPSIWLSLTAHGRDARNEHRVGFGDDAAVAGGLVCRDETGPVFCADAVADPLAGMTGALSVLEAVAEGGAQLIDVALSRVAASFAGPTLPAVGAARQPTAGRVRGAAAEPGAHTAEVLNEWGVR